LLAPFERRPGEPRGELGNGAHAAALLGVANLAVASNSGCSSADSSMLIDWSSTITPRNQ
jgi:hypothetical protein